MCLAAAFPRYDVAALSCERVSDCASEVQAASRSVLGCDRTVVILWHKKDFQHTFHPHMLKVLFLTFESYGTRFLLQKHTAI